MKKIIYIAGKVTGEDPTTCAQKFQDMENLLKAKGYRVLNPIKLVNNPNQVWSVAMKICLDKLLTASAIFMLPCSVDSKGAQKELDLAIKKNKDIYTNIEDVK